MGLLAAALGMGLAMGDTDTPLGVSFSAAHHILVKGALFLAIGVAASVGPRLWQVTIPAAVLGLSLGGLPLTGGALAKLALKGQFGAGFVGTLAALSAAASTMLMLHFLRCLAETAPRFFGPGVRTEFTWPWLIAALMAGLVPWALYLTIESGTLLGALAPGTLWAALWPVLIGAAVGLGLWRWRHRLPDIPHGDVVVVGEAAIPAIVSLGEAIERADGYLRQWQVASLTLLALVIILGTAMLAWG
jgi:hypothetical protein